MRFDCKHYTRENPHDNGKFQPFEDVSPIETDDFPLLCWFSGGVMGLESYIPVAYKSYHYHLLSCGNSQGPMNLQKGMN